MRVGGDGFQQADEPARHQGDRVPVEEVGAVGDLPGDAGRGAALVVALAQLEVEVELHRGGLEVGHAHPQPGQAQFGLRGVPQREHDLEEGVPAQGTGRVEHLDQPLEGHVGVGVGRQVRFGHAADEPGEVRVPGGVGAQHQGVDEEADEVVEGLVVPAGDRGADGDVRTGAELGQQGGEAGLQHHEQACAVFPCQAGEAVVEGGSDLEGHHPAAVAEFRRPGPVREQGQLLGQPGEGLAPVGQLSGDPAVRVLFVAEHLALPQGVVGVLDGQRCEVRCAVRGAGGVGRGDVARERCHGPAVARDVVQHDQEDVLVRCGREQRGAQG